MMFVSVYRCCLCDAHIMCLLFEGGRSVIYFTKAWDLLDMDFIILFVKLERILLILIKGEKKI